jgi:ataxia telangiectasia mutated family protein
MSKSQPAGLNQQNLQRLVIRMCQDHPFHSLYQVYCLKPAAQPATRQSGRFVPPSTQSDRATAANEIFDRLRADERSSQRVRDVEKLCNVCLDWANYPMKEKKEYQGKRGGGYPVPKNSSILTLQNLKVPVMTAHTPLDHTTKYDNFVSIISFATSFDLCGGKSLPKVSACFGSDGLKYKQLVSSERCCPRTLGLTSSPVKRRRNGRPATGRCHGTSLRARQPRSPP